MKIQFIFLFVVGLFLVNLASAQTSNIFYECRGTGRDGGVTIGFEPGRRTLYEETYVKGRPTAIDQKVLDVRVGRCPDCYEVDYQGPLNTVYHLRMNGLHDGSIRASL